MTAIIVWVVFAVAAAGMGLLWRVLLAKVRPDICAALVSATVISLALLVVDGATGCAALTGFVVQVPGS